ncbi:Dimethylglycine oxidase [Methylobacterium crusticola]|uniref:Dimethylglycine oxidase n=1 Tax=Methylobacterium crusticola TaxID=1697972 RepID=A0ABQ4QWP9_9HYPH|nr:FAD-dependent oxidoreductase [Methylobacterium crusticola]GJD49786.1 Dimethylglycine oxidase [Methylobacterium crusticola]
MQTKARLVIIGAGIVGCSTAYHLAKRGWRDIVVLDQGPLPHTGGSTSHAPGGLSLISGSRFLTELARYSVPLYASLAVEGLAGAAQVGGLEVAKSPERWAELKRRAGWGKSFGVECHLLTPAECGAKAPLLDPSSLLGGLFTPGAGIGRPVTACQAMTREAESLGAVRFQGGTTVVGLTLEGGRIREVVTDRGRIETEAVLLAAGIWGPILGRMAGITVPLQPMEHLYATVGPVPELAALGTDIAMPIVRVHDNGAYCRMHGAEFGIGNYDHAPLSVDPEDIVSHRVSREPTKRAFTPEHFSRTHRAVEALFPAIQGKPVTHSFNGMFSFTPDGMPVLGPHRDVGNLWLGEAVWVTHGGGVGRLLADWMTDGHPGMDVREADVNRFTAHALTRAYIRTRGRESYRNTHAVIHPAEPMALPRDLRRTAFHARVAERGGVFVEAGGWERAAWCEANAALAETASVPARAGWEARHWSPIQGAEHLATRRAAGLYDVSPLTKTLVAGPGALALLQEVCTNDMDVPVGQVAYTLSCEENGGIRSDMTVVRLAPDRFRIMGSAASGPRDQAWLRAHAERLRSDAAISDETSALCGLGLWGPAARDILARATASDVSNEAIPYYTARQIEVGVVPALALRISYVGEHGYEIYTPTEYGLRLWDALWDAGQEHGLIAGGTGAMDSLRVEKGYRRLGADIHADADPFAAGLGFAVDLTKPSFIGRPVLAERLITPAGRKLACLTLDDPAAVVLGREPILAGDRTVGYVTSSNTGYSVGRHIAFGYLPDQFAVPGQSLAVEYFGQRFAARVVAEPLFDTGGARLEG